MDNLLRRGHARSTRADTSEVIAAHDRTTQVDNENNRVSRDVKALHERVQKDQKLHDGVFRDLAELQEQQVRNFRSSGHA